MDVWKGVSVKTIKNCSAKCGITEQTSEDEDDIADEEFNALLNELVHSQCNMTVEEYVNFDVVTCSSLPAISSDMVESRVSSVKACVIKYLREERSDLHEVVSDNDDDKDDDNDVSSKDVEFVEIGTVEAPTADAWQVSKPERPIKERKKLFCRHEKQIREDKSAEQKAKSYQWWFNVRIKFMIDITSWYFVL